MLALIAGPSACCVHVASSTSNGSTLAFRAISLPRAAEPLCLTSFDGSKDIQATVVDSVLYDNSTTVTTTLTSAPSSSITLSYDSGSKKLNWNSVSGATGYKVHFTKTPGGSQTISTALLYYLLGTGSYSSTSVDAVNGASVLTSSNTLPPFLVP